MDKFPLKWRWTDDDYYRLPDEELEKILPLTQESAKDTWKKSLTFIDLNNEFLPNPELFDSIEIIESNDSDNVIRWLSEKITSDTIILSWQPEFSVKTCRDVFLRYWDEFCYPSDDLSIWPDSEEWVIHHWHYGKLCYGKSKNV